MSEPLRDKSYDNGPLVTCKCDCGNVVERRLYPLRRGTVRSCGCFQKEVAAAKLANVQRPKPLRRPRLRKDGYRLIYRPSHPRATQRGYVLEHIVVMETMIGRELLPGETVHHRNGERSDNKPKNLELWDTNHCAGQRHTEKMAFHTQEIVTKASDEELTIIQSAIERRLRERAA